MVLGSCRVEMGLYVCVQRKPCAGFVCDASCGMYNWITLFHGVDGEFEADCVT